MITEAILSIIFNIVSGFFGLLPEVSLDINSLVYQNAISLIQGVCYLLPASSIVAIMSFIMSLQAMRIIVSMIKTVWVLLPLV